LTVAARKPNNRTKLIDANGNVTTYAYDDLYRITRMTDPLGATTRYAYDENNNVLSTTDALSNITTRRPLTHSVRSLGTSMTTQAISFALSTRSTGLRPTSTTCWATARRRLTPMGTPIRLPMIV
jgi:YD repeat-containing protein